MVEVVATAKDDLAAGDVLDGLGLKPDEKLAGFIHIGKPTKPSEDRPRPFLSEIVTRF